MTDSIENINDDKKLTPESSGKQSGGQPGNQNNKKGKIFFDEIRKQLIQDPKKLRSIVEGLIEAADAREPWAVKEIMDRMDGKAIQSTELTGPDGADLVSGIKIQFVEPNANPER
jgi:hypothetical protein